MTLIIVNSDFCVCIVDNFVYVIWEDATPNREKNITVWDLGKENHDLAHIFVIENQSKP